MRHLSQPAMHRLRAARRLSAWLGIAAMLLSVMVPAVSRMLAAQGSGSSWAEVCTLEGAQYVRTAGHGDHDTRSAPAPTDSQPHGGDCLYCALGVGALALPPPAMAALAPMPAGPREAIAAAFYSAPVAAIAWVTPAPRAPPGRA